MTNMIAKAGAAALIAIASLTATVSTASAGGYGHGSGAGFTIQFGERGHNKGHNSHNRHHSRQFAACAPRHAVKKARWNGLHRAHIQRVSPRHVVVSGYRHHRHDRMVFANVPGCPLIRR
ncbi:hypothetical protein ACQQ2Q_11735 [Agrobacterium sp. ES01]|uniref:hypothetical protein n=1 Tax=Agrobacterium sp. ES01 TaxID=3420714 RepID=UPI003D09946A